MIETGAKSSMRLKVLAIALFAVLMLGLAPIAPFSGQQAWASQIDRPSDFEGVVYITYSHDGQFAAGNTDSGYMAGVPLSIEDMYLQDYDSILGNSYVYDADDDGIQEVTLIRALLYALDMYGMGTQDVTLNGPSGSMYFPAGLWHYDNGAAWNENLYYYYNGMYPQKRFGVGATGDQVTLHDGDMITILHSSNWGFYSDFEEGGFLYFASDAFADEGYEATGTLESDLRDCIATDFQAKVGTPLEIAVAKSFGTSIPGVGETGVDTDMSLYDGATVFSGTSLYGPDAVSWDTDGGIASVTFDQPGEYVIWTSASDVQCPAYATVTVQGAPEPVHEHDWDDGVVTKQPTETEQGEITYTCKSDPTHVRTEPIAKLEKLAVDHPGNPLWISGQSAQIVAQVANPLPDETVLSWLWEYSSDGKNWKKTGAKMVVEDDVTCSLVIPECTQARRPPMAWRATATTSAGRKAVTVGQSLSVPEKLEVVAAGVFPWVEGAPVVLKAKAVGLAAGETIQSVQWYYSRDNANWAKTGAKSQVTDGGTAVALSGFTATLARRAPMAWSARITTSTGRTATSEGISLVG